MRRSANQTRENAVGLNRSSSSAWAGAIRRRLNIRFRGGPEVARGNTLGAAGRESLQRSVWRRYPPGAVNLGFEAAGQLIVERVMRRMQARARGMTCG